MSSEKSGIGRFYGVGVGPGDPELMTLKAARILSRVPVIFVPQKDRKSRSYAKSIVDKQIKKSDTEVVGLVLPMLRDREKLADYWRQAADTIWQYLEKGNDCAFVNVGDPLLYGTFIHILETLRERFDYVIVDTPPVLAVTDPCSVAAQVDGVYMTMRLKKNSRATASRAAEMLQSVGGKVLGVVVNGAGQNKRYGYGHANYKTYGADNYGPSRYGYYGYGASLKEAEKYYGASATISCVGRRNGH